MGIGDWELETDDWGLGYGIGFDGVMGLIGMVLMVDEFRWKYVSMGNVDTFLMSWRWSLVWAFYGIFGSRLYELYWTLRG